MKADFRFTAEGDLELGSPSFNEDGELLYITPIGEITTDSSEGQLIRDIPLQVSYLSEKQVILNRLKTDNPDWALHNTIGADLADLVGMPNTRETGLLGKASIEACLTYDNFISINDLTVRPVPVSSSQILFHISVKRPTINIVLPVVFDLEHGLLTEYEVNN